MTALPLPLVLWAGLLLGIAVIDVGAYLAAAGRAQGAADAAALAALAGPEVRHPGRSAAARTAAVNGARLERCRCGAGAERASVTASVPVPGLFVPRVTGRQRVTATADARLTTATSPSTTPPGPWRQLPPAPP